MPRPPSKHGLERKYKPWRRGMSKKGATKNRSSLKNKLRGKERLLAKLSKQDENYDARREELEVSIRQLKAEMDKNVEKDRERKNAVESHGTRFLERQRLTRMERTIRKHLKDADNEDKERFQEELRLVALDQVYVAHYPHDVKYQPLFRKGVRIVHTKQAAHRRAAVRQRILQKLSNEKVDTVKWISADQYNCVPKEWSVDMETSVFGCREKSKLMDGNEETPSDDRFALNQQHSALLEAAEQMEATLDETNEEERDRNDKHSDSNESAIESEESDVDVVDPLQRQGPPEKPAEELSHSAASSSSDDESDDNSTSSSTSSGSSDEEESKEGTNKLVTSSNLGSSLANEDVKDDFLIPVGDDDEAANVFENATKHVPPWDHTKGDKSQGWATQRQRPGQHRKKQRIR